MKNIRLVNKNKILNGVIRKGGNITIFSRNPYKNIETEAYCTAINILAVEYLVKTVNREEYSRRVEQIYALSEDDLTILHIDLSLNMHTSTLGAMITQNDYNTQREYLLHFLDHPEER